MRRQIVAPAEDDEISAAIDVEYDDASKIEKDFRDEEAEIQAHFGDADGDADMHYQVRKFLPDTKDKFFCCEGTRADFPILPKIQARFGGGKYEVWIFKHKKLYRRMRVGVMEPRKEESPQAPDAGLSAILAAIQTQTKMVENFVAPKQSGLFAGLTAKDVLLLAPPIITALAALGKGGSTKDMLETMQIAKGLFDKSDDGDREPDSLMGLLSNVLTKTPLIDAVSKAALAPLAPQRPQVAASPEQAQAAQLKQQLAYMITRAQKNSPPELYADFLEDNLPPQFVAMLSQPGALAYLETLHPPIGTYRPWFEALLQSLANAPSDGEEENEPVSEQRSPVVPSNYDPRWSGRGSGDFAGNGQESESGETFAGNPSEGA